MVKTNAIYTQQRECQDCHKCIRVCPVKAICVENGYARIVPESCIQCGNCVLVCPHNAKRVRDDLPAAKALLSGGRRVVASLAPSFVAQYSGAHPGKLIHALRRLGFFAVSETALGAQQVSAGTYALMRNGENQVWVSSACPVVVDYIAKYRPDCQPNVTALLSPLLTHCKMLRSHFGDEIGVVFIGPCIAKKKEAEAHPELLDVVLTFEDLDRWLEEENIRLGEIAETPEDRFEPEQAEDGALYPIEGGMFAGVSANGEVEASRIMAFSGIANVDQALKGIAEWKPEHSILLELTACAGACINGPKAAHQSSVAKRRYNVAQYARPADALPRPVSVLMERAYPATPVEKGGYTEAQICDALRMVGKYSAEDELNCGGCGYESCRDFAHALLARNAERMMCATYTRKLAQKKANALLQKMPSAVVIADEQLRIIECNSHFVSLFSDDAVQPKELEGSLLGAVVPFSHLFRRVLESGEDIVGHDIRFRRIILNASIFTIEPHSVLCGILQDITQPIFQKEQIVARAHEVIRKNLNTVQQIAYLLGENAADSEIILNSIVQSFSPEDVEELDSGGGGD
jgi:iron only hydrogenase large subunit-like protein